VGVIRYRIPVLFPLTFYSPLPLIPSRQGRGSVTFYEVIIFDSQRAVSKKMEARHVYENT